jgi:hypothetical protein
MLKNILQYKGVTQGTVIVVMLLSTLCSCSVFKSKKTEYSKTDSTSSKIENTITKAKVDSFAVRKSQTEEDNSIVFDFGDRQIIVTPNDSNYSDKGIYVTDVKADDYFYWDGEKLLTNVIPKKVTIKGKKKELTVDSTAKHIDFIEEHSKLEHTEFTKEEKKVDKVKHVFSLLWLLWLLLIPIGYFIYKHRHKIAAFYPF